MNNESGQNLEKSVEKKGKSADHKEQSERKLPPTISGESGLPSNVPPTAQSQNKSENNLEPVKPHPPNWCDILTVILEVFGIIGLGVYCAYTIAEWKTFDRERKTMETELRVSQTNFLQDERAWISVTEPGSVLPYTQDHIGMGVKLINSGKTPAYIDSIDITVELIGQNITNIIYRKKITNMVIAPNREPIIQMIVPTAIGEQNFELLQQEKVGCGFSLKVTYRDAFGVVRHTGGGFLITGTQENISPGHILPAFGESWMD